MLAGHRAAAPQARRTAEPTANLFESLGKIVDYNKKYWSTAASGLFDDRTARASHVLFGFAKYDDADGKKRAEDLKVAIESGEISFADAASEFSTCPSAARGGDLGTFKRNAMVPEFDSSSLARLSLSGVSTVRSRRNLVTTSCRWWSAQKEGVTETALGLFTDHVWITSCVACLLCVGCAPPRPGAASRTSAEGKT